MFNKYKNNTVVIVNGIGKCESKKYKNMIGIVVCRDPYFKDYNVEFLDGSDDWFEGYCLESV